MDKRWHSMILSLVLLWIFPAFVMTFLDERPNHAQEPALETTQTRSTHLPETEEKIPVLVDGKCVELTWESYLTGVLLSEIPGFFHPEAKKAQAVVARTYAMKVLNGNKHESGAVCNDHTCCQGYLSEERYMDLFDNNETVEDARNAVQQTAGIVVTYHGELINATYFSCSGGFTEAAVEVWGTDIPYLQSVSSPGEEGAAVFTDTAQFDSETFSKLLGVSLTGPPVMWFEKIEYTQSGGVKTIRICGKDYTGMELRLMLGLRSAVFTVSVSGDQILFTTKGFGHRVGMSQYGADAMGKGGYSYEEILKHYYQGVELEMR